MTGKGAHRSKEKVDFDQYAAQYKALLDGQKTGFGGDRSYFSRYKIETLRRIFPAPVNSFLDFGSGVGLTIPFIKEYFPEATIFATDISTGSLAYIAENYPYVSIVSDESVADMRFDIILVSGVLHHIAPELRNGIARRLGSMLEAGGSLCVFEHNPYNPMTRHLVSTCAFDTDAVLLQKKETIDLLKRSAGLEVAHDNYSLFFPHALRHLRPLEKSIGWLPLGGQYYVIGRARP